MYMYYRSFASSYSPSGTANTQQLVNIAEAETSSPATYHQPLPQRTQCRITASTPVAIHSPAHSPVLTSPHQSSPAPLISHQTTRHFPASRINSINKAELHLCGIDYFSSPRSLQRTMSAHPSPPNWTTTIPPKNNIRVTPRTPSIEIDEQMRDFPG
jgi:hypothetical protein